MTFGTAYDQVSTWDSAASSWKHWVNDSDFNDFTQFEYGKTYEIYNKTGSDKSLTVTGKTTALDITHSIVSGDNFISPAVKSATNVSTVLGSLALGTDFSDIKRFNATTQTWESYASSQFTQFEPGKGYNIVGLRSSNFSYGKTETTTTFVYDSTGARVKKTAAGTTTIYLGKDYDIVGTLSTKYIFLGDRRVALKDSSGTKLFFHEDHINSSNIITDASGDQAAMYEYDPYGATVTQTGSAEVKHRFTGQEADDSTGLYYYGARYYDSQLGRFITADPTVQRPGDPQDFNRYAYCRNNPIKYTDPSGLSWFSKLIGAIVGIAVGVATGNPILGFAAFAATDSVISARQQGASWGQAITRGAISFGVSLVGGYALGPIASQLGGAIGGLVGSEVGGLAGATLGKYAGLAADGAIQGALYGGFNGGATTALYGGNLKEIAGSTLQGAYTGAIYGSIAAPIPAIVRDLGKAVPTVASKFRELMGQLNLNGQEGYVRVSRGTDELPSNANIWIGSKRNPIEIQDGANQATSMFGRVFSGHALDEMQSQGIMPSVVEETIKNGRAFSGNTPGTTRYYSSNNNVTAVVNNKGNVITAYLGGKGR